MKRPTLLGLALAAALVLAACSTAPVNDVYTAAGDGSAPDDLTRTATFKPDDDLNLVVILNTHRRTLPVHATFTDPAGTTYTTDPIEAGSTVGELVLGLDFELQSTTAWTPGAWQAAVFVDGEQEQTLNFTVQQGAAQPAGAG